MKFAIKDCSDSCSLQDNYYSNNYSQELELEMKCRCQIFSISSIVYYSVFQTVLDLLHERFHCFCMNHTELSHTDNGFYNLMIQTLAL